MVVAHLEFPHWSLVSILTQRNLIYSQLIQLELTPNGKQMLLEEARKPFENFWKKITKTKNKIQVFIKTHQNKADGLERIINKFLDEDSLKLACQALLEVVQSSSKNIELGLFTKLKVTYGEVIWNALQIEEGFDHVIFSWNAPKSKSLILGPFSAWKLVTCYLFKGPIFAMLEIIARFSIESDNSKSGAFRIKSTRPVFKQKKGRKWKASILGHFI